MTQLNLALLFILTITLTACGFHLRGTNGDSYRFPFQTVYVECNNVIVCQNLTTAIKTQDLAKLVNTPESAEVIIKLVKEQTSRDILSINSVGRVSAYLLTYQMQAQVWQNQEQINNDISVAAQATMQYNNSTILADTKEEANMWDLLHQKATNQLVRQLIHFKYRNFSLNDTESK